MRSPEDIKKGMECCAQSLPYPCSGCPYERDEQQENAWKCDLDADALAYTQQLKARNAKLKKTIERMIKYVPPVDIGTPIFSVVWNDDSEGFHVMENVVEDIWYNCNGWFFIERGHRGPAFKASDIGHVIYLNREDADAICEEFNFKLPRKSKRI